VYACEDDHDSKDGAAKLSAAERRMAKGRKEGGVGQTPLDLILPSPPLSSSLSDGEGEGGKTDGKRTAAAGPLLSVADEMDQRAAKRARLVARARFGETARVGDGKGVERVDVVIEDLFPRAGGGDRRSGGDADNGDDYDEEEDDEEGKWRPRVRLTFHGTHVFAGIRQLVEAGIVDGERMPGWMTGEEGVTVGAVRRGRIRGHKGSGMP
jgi:central kinetochore subunit Mis15/CHL4